MQAVIVLVVMPEGQAGEAGADRASFDCLDGRCAVRFVKNGVLCVGCVKFRKPLIRSGFQRSMSAVRCPDCPDGSGQSGSRLRRVFPPPVANFSVVKERARGRSFLCGVPRPPEEGSSPARSIFCFGWAETNRLPGRGAPRVAKRFGWCELAECKILSDACDRWLGRRGFACSQPEQRTARSTCMMPRSPTRTVELCEMRPVRSGWSARAVGCPSGCGGRGRCGVAPPNGADAPRTRSRQADLFAGVIPGLTRRAGFCRPLGSRGGWWRGCKVRETVAKWVRGLNRS